MNVSELPVSYRRNADLFEVGFCFFLMPAMVATMDHSPFHVGGKVLLWLVCWFQYRRMGAGDRTRVLSGIAPFLRPLPAVVALVCLASAGVALALALRAPELAGAMAFGLPIYAILSSLPAVLLTWAYVPVRFEGVSWLPKPVVSILPPLTFVGLHLSTARWAAVLLSLALALVAWGVSRFRTVSVLALVAIHAVVAWLGVMGGAW